MRCPGSGGQEVGLSVLLIEVLRLWKSGCFSFCASWFIWVGGEGEGRQPGRHERRAGRGSRVEGREKTGGGTRLDQSCSQAIPNKIMNYLLLAEPYLGLGGMHVDVHFLGWQFEEEQHHRKAGGRDHIAIRLAD